ncbi:hypothetical protein BH09PSE3_BH09PSE3_27080 [soil metagenome]
MVGLVRSDWNLAFAAVNKWRGECMHHFSAVEMAVTETLFALDAAKLEGVTIGLRHFIGQRLEDLTSAVAQQGPFGVQAKAARQMLEHYRREHEGFRTTLCHGMIKVVLECNGKWLLIVRNLSIVRRQADAGLVVLEQAEAEAKLAALKHDGQKLSATRGQLRKTFAVRSAASLNPSQ